MPYNSVFKDDSFKGKTIVVTGGGCGIGRCTAHELSSPGAEIALAGRKQEKHRSYSARLVAVQSE